MADSRRRRFKTFIEPVSPAPRPPVAGVPVKMRGERRHVLRATPTGKIFWAGYNQHQEAITEQVIRQQVRSEANWK